MTTELLREDRRHLLTELGRRAPDRAPDEAARPPVGIPAPEKR